MNVFTKIKEGINKLLTKKQRREKRVKGYRIKGGVDTAAAMLIQNNWGITFSNPEPKRAGEKRAAERLAKHRKIWS